MQKNNLSSSVGHIVNTPKLRFPEFSGEWEKKKLGEISKMQAGKFVNASDIMNEWNDGLYPCYGGNGLRGFTNLFNVDGKYSLIGRQGAHCGNVNLAIGKFYATEHAVVVYLKEGMDTDFMYYLLGNMNLNQYSTGLAQPGLAVQNVEKIEAFISGSLSEQQKIASFLSAVDDKLQAVKKKKALFEQYKKGVIQKIFSQELRFRDDDGKDYQEWYEKKLGDIMDFKVTNSFSRDNLNYENGMIKNIHYGDIHTKFQTLFDITKEEVPFVNEEIYLGKISEDFYCKEGDVVFADASEDLNDVGKSIEIVNLNNERLLSGLHTLLARPKEYVFSKGFIGYLLKSPNVRLQIQKEAQGSKVLSINVGRISNIILQFPCRSEQTKIANFLSAIDEKIHMVQGQVEKMEVWKKGLLQKMFA